MPSQPPLPPLLTSYLSDQRESSLTLVPSILGATSNWLVLRYLYAALGTSSSSNISIGTDELANGAKRKVVLVSFLRGWEFWRAEAKRLVSSDYKHFPDMCLSNRRIRRLIKEFAYVIPKIISY
jgi:elongator complex protein 6